MLEAAASLTTAAGRFRAIAKWAWRNVMVLRLRIGPDTNASQWRIGHRSLSLLCSTALHCGLVMAVALPPPELATENRQIVYRATVMPLLKEHKVIYYDFRKELPEVSAANAPSRITSPGGSASRSGQRILAEPQQKAGKQFVWLPAPKVTLREELKAPNLIALQKPRSAVTPILPQLLEAQALEPSLPRIGFAAHGTELRSMQCLCQRTVVRA